jgi:glycosyltransferase involved in cell wall biosynthesis
MCATATKERIALFVPSLRGGGAERVMLNLAQGFVDKGFAVDLVLANAEGPYLASVPPEVKVVDLRSRRVLWSMLRLVRYLRQTRPTVLLSAMDHANVVAFSARALSRVPTRAVGTIHNTLGQTVASAHTLRDRFMPLWVRMFYPLGAHLVAVSEGVAQDFVSVTGIDRRRVSVILNPVITHDLFDRANEPLHHPWFLYPGPPVILGIGRLTKQKGFLDLVRAFAIFRSRQPARLMILGEGEDRPKIEGLVRVLGLDEDVSLPGFVQNPYPYLRRANAFVLSSEWEGLPTVLIEAIAMGTPVVATDCPSGPSEILRHDSRWLVPVGDVEALASALEARLAISEPLNVGLEPYELDSVVEQYLRVLDLPYGVADTFPSSAERQTQKPK